MKQWLKQTLTWSPFKAVRGYVITGHESWKKSSLSISYFSHCCNKTPNKSKLRRKDSFGSRSECPIQHGIWKSRRQEFKATDHIVHNEEASRKGYRCSTHFQTDCLRPQNDVICSLVFPLLTSLSRNTHSVCQWRV